MRILFRVMTGIGAAGLAAGLTQDCTAAAAITLGTTAGYSKKWTAGPFRK